MRAVADNPDLAASTRHRHRRVITSCGSSAAASPRSAACSSASSQIKWDYGLQLLLLVFAAVTLGGLGNAFGAMVGASSIGSVRQTVDAVRRRRAEERRGTVGADLDPAVPATGHSRSTERIGDGLGFDLLERPVHGDQRRGAGLRTHRHRPERARSATPACSTSARSASWPSARTASASPSRSRSAASGVGVPLGISSSIVLAPVLGLPDTATPGGLSGHRHHRRVARSSDCSSAGDASVDHRWLRRHRTGSPTASTSLNPLTNEALRFRRPVDLRRSRLLMLIVGWTHRGHLRVHRGTPHAVAMGSCASDPRGRGRRSALGKNVYASRCRA